MEGVDDSDEPVNQEKRVRRCVGAPVWRRGSCRGSARAALMGGLIVPDWNGYRSKIRERVVQKESGYLDRR